MQERLNRLYEQYGYRKFKMSRFEDYDLYAQNRDFLRQDRIITFTDADGALKALKPDITLSIMKSNGGDSEKVYYNENVCREVGGAFREILQVGVESVGQIDPYAEAEVIALAARSLEQLSPKYVLALSDVSFVGSLLDQMGLSAPVRGKVLGLVARKNVPGLCVLAERGELTGEQADGLRELVELYAPLKEGIGRVGRLAKSNAAWETLRQLSLTAGLLESFGLEERVRLDFSLVNSMDYYNGVIFQGFLPGLHTPVLSGGRYDNLPRKMGKQVGAIGFALSMGLLEERADGGRFDADVLLTYGPDAELAGLAAFAEALRASGRSVRCERAGGSAQLRCRTELRYRSGMTRRRWDYDQCGAAQGAAGGEGLRGLCLRRVRLPRDFGEKPQADL